MARALITGGGGFIGSHLAEDLVNSGWKVVILDDLSTGLRNNIAGLLTKARGSVELVVGDCTQPRCVERALRNVDAVFHFAANPEVRLDKNDSKRCFHQNILATYVLLDEVKDSQAESIVFASTSAVYGEARTTPTPEDYSPLEPVSLYGASKLAGEALVIAYSHTYKKRGIILRLANIVGPRSSHGVVRDFVEKLSRNPKEMAVLGNGAQTKSYLYVEDCVKAISVAYKESRKRVDIFNVGSEDQVAVKKIAEIVVEEMGLDGTTLTFAGDENEGKGWVGDVRNMLLDTKKIKFLGWTPSHNSEQSIRRTVKEMRE